MALTYTWKVDRILTKDEVNDSDVTFANSVVQTHWTKTGTDSNGNQGMFYGSTPFTAINSNISDFIAFDNLVESDVIGWIQQVVIGDYEIRVNKTIQDIIDETKQITPQERTMPWALAAPVDSADSA